METFKDLKPIRPVLSLKKIVIYIHKLINFLKTNNETNNSFNRHFQRDAVDDRAP